MHKLGVNSLAFSLLGVLWLLPSQTQAVAVADMVQLAGVAVGDQVAHQIDKGDFNGDGYDDLVIGTQNVTTGSTQNGAIYIVYGGADALTSGSLNTTAVSYIGEASGDWFGFAVASAGDVNGDGYDDILASALFNDDGVADTGAAYLVYGQADTLSGGSISSAVEFTSTTAGQGLGYDVGGAGDLNNDGYDDFLVGDYSHDGAGVNAGAVYVVYGRAAVYTSTTISAVGTTFTGVSAGDNLGATTRQAGDLNNDGFADAVFGAYGVDSPTADTGAVYILYGSSTAATGTQSVSTLVRLTGEGTGGQVGFAAAGAGDVNGDGYDDLVVADSFYDDGINQNAGAVYVVYGQAAQLSSGSLSSYARITGPGPFEYLGYYVGRAGDLNADGYADLIMSAPYTNSSTGAVYIVDGQATAMANAAIATTADVTFTGEAGSDLLGYGLVGANLNGDSYPELVTSAPYNDSGANASGTVYVGYLRIDADGDGTLSSAGILEQGTDCNDDDATVVADQTYYLDEDGDDLGVDTETTVLCSSTAPTGYADNTDDTNDEIKNNGIEIIGDEVDNDGDGEVDETNTKAENGSHPEYGSDDPTDADAVAAAIVSVKAKKQGKVRVRYADDSVYVYTIFGRPGSRKPSLKQYPNSGYYGVLDKAGKKIALLNVLNGKVVDTTPIDGKGFRKHFLQFTDLRDDGTMDVVITSKHRSSTIVRVAIAAVRVSHHRRIRLYATQTIDAPQTVLRNTTIVGNTIDIRDTQTAIVSLLVTKQHKLKQL